MAMIYLGHIGKNGTDFSDLISFSKSQEPSCFYCHI